MPGRTGSIIPPLPTTAGVLLARPAASCAVARQSQYPVTQKTPIHSPQLTRGTRSAKRASLAFLFAEAITATLASSGSTHSVKKRTLSRGDQRQRAARGHVRVLEPLA